MKEAGARMKARLLLALVVLVVICFKIPHLHYGFYIDEGWVYAPAIKAMAAHGPSLMPDAIPPELTRGHPLLFHFLCSWWMKVFGASNIAIHSFALMVSVIFLVVLFECCLRLFGEKVACLALLLVATRVIFFVQSSFAYPEVMVALFAVLALYYYAKDRLLPLSIALAGLFFTKEGGVIIGAVIGVHAAISMFGNNGSVSRKLLRLFAIIAPTILIGLFFVIQKQKLGWYIFPEHNDLIRTTWESYYVMLKSGLYWSFMGDKAMCVLMIFTLLLSIGAAVKTKKPQWLFLFPAAFIVFSHAEMFPTKATDWVAWTVLFTIACMIPLYYLVRLNKNLSPVAKKFIVLAGICVVAYILYSSLTQIAYRYLLVNIVLTLIILALCIESFSEAISKNLFAFNVAVILLIGAYGFYTNDRVEDTQLGAFRVMNVETHEFAFLEQENAYDKEIAYNCTWEHERLTDTAQGFLLRGRPFTHMKRFPVGPDADYVLFGNSCYDSTSYHNMRTNSNFYSVCRVSDGDVWAEVFKRRSTRH